MTSFEDSVIQASVIDDQSDDQGMHEEERKEESALTTSSHRVVTQVDFQAGATLIDTTQKGEASKDRNLFNLNDDG